MLVSLLLNLCTFAKDRLTVWEHFFWIFQTPSKPEYYAELEKYLESRVIPNDFWNYVFKRGKKIDVSLSGNKEISYQEGKESIRTQTWDVAFTLSPALSVEAKNNNYSYFARMFADKPTYYRAVLYVKNDSPIESIDNLNENTVIGLGDFSSTSGFYVPVYDLYGKTLSVQMDSPDIQESVLRGEVDIGTGVIDWIQDKPDFRIIHTSRDIPGSGVYFSPKLSSQDQNSLRKVLLNAPEKIRKDANYGAGDEPDYTEFVKIRKRVEDLLACANFSKNPVNLYCKNQDEIIGRVNGGTAIDSTTNRLIVSSKSGIIYQVIVSKFILPHLATVQGKTIRINGGKPKEINPSVYEIRVSQPDQVIIEN